MREVRVCMYADSLAAGSSTGGYSTLVVDGSGGRWPVLPEQRKEGQAKGRSGVETMGGKWKVEDDKIGQEVVGKRGVREKKDTNV